MAQAITLKIENGNNEGEHYSSDEEAVEEVVQMQ